jgi:hypothetical protein
MPTEPLQTLNHPARGAVATITARAEQLKADLQDNLRTYVRGAVPLLS